jgi:IS5 family transposase
LRSTASARKRATATAKPSTGIHHAREEILDALGLDRDDLPDPSAICKSFDRFQMYVWRQLLRGGAQQLPPTIAAAIDATFFERDQLSYHYKRRSEHPIRSIKATALVDTATTVVMDVHCSVAWRHDTKSGPQVARRNAGDLRSLAADKGFDDQSFRDELRDEGVRPLIKHREFTPLDAAHNERLDDTLYNQRWMAETAFAAVKCSLGSAVRARSWYRQFREIVLMFAVHNLRQELPTL